MGTWDPLCSFWEPVLPNVDFSDMYHNRLMDVIEQEIAKSRSPFWMTTLLVWFANISIARVRLAMYLNMIATGKTGFWVDNLVSIHLLIRMHWNINATFLTWQQQTSGSQRSKHLLFVANLIMVPVCQLALYHRDRRQSLGNPEMYPALAIVDHQSIPSQCGCCLKLER